VLAEGLRDVFCARPPPVARIGHSLSQPEQLSRGHLLLRGKAVAEERQRLKAHRMSERGCFADILPEILRNSSYGRQPISHGSPSWESYTMRWVAQKTSGQLANTTRSHLNLRRRGT